MAFYVFILSMLLDAASWPFAFYNGFLLERRYGLATQTARQWVTDHLKAVGIGLLFAEAGAGFVYAALRSWPDGWWLVSALAYGVVALGLVNLAPVLLLPIFFAFKPVDRAALRERLLALAARAHTSINGVYEWRLSDRTKKANAALAGIGNTRRILLSDTLLAGYSDDEIEVILAHELAHHVYRDIWSTILLDGALTLAGFFLVDRLLQAAVPRLGLRGASDVAGLPLLLIAGGALGLAARPLINAVSRAHERRADRYALEMTMNPAAFMTAMKRLGQQNLAEDDPSPLVRAFFYTHPPIKERLEGARQVQLEN